MCLDHTRAENKSIVKIDYSQYFRQTYHIDVQLVVKWSIFIKILSFIDIQTRVDLDSLWSVLNVVGVVTLVNLNHLTLLSDQIDTILTDWRLKQKMIRNMSTMLMKKKIMMMKNSPLDHSLLRA